MPIAGVGLLLGAACVSAGDSPAFPPGSPGTAGASSAAPTPTDPPAALHADQAGVWEADPGRWSVVLTWMPAPGFTADHYEVTRDGRRLDDGSTATRLVDRAVLPETTYRYGVTAVDAGGVRTETASIQVETNAPALRDARLEGRFRVRMHVVEQRGLQGDVDGGTMLFTFDPACAGGPCDVTWRRAGRAGSGRLNRDRGTYAGTADASFQIRSCQGGILRERLILATKVLAASAAHGWWQAAKIRGRLHESAVAPGCMPAGIRWRFAGFVQTLSPS
jgi:hypothetical protein